MTTYNYAQTEEVQSCIARNGEAWVEEAVGSNFDSHPQFTLEKRVATLEWFIAHQCDAGMTEEILGRLADMGLMDSQEAWIRQFALGYHPELSQLVMA